jgi:hypothetical protein
MNYKEIGTSNETEQYRSWLRHFTTNRNVEGSIPDEVSAFFNCPNPSSQTMALALT